MAISRDEAVEKALYWAERAELAAQQYPHIPSSELPHVATAVRMSRMWSDLARELDDTRWTEHIPGEPWL